LPSSFLPASVNFLWPTFRWQQSSWINLNADGTVSAHCSEEGARQVSRDAEQEIKDIGAVERRVASAVAEAWSHFRTGNIAQAARAIGQVPLAEVLFVPPTPPLSGLRLLRPMAYVIAIYMIWLLGVVLFANTHDRIFDSFVRFELLDLVLLVLVVLMVLAAIIKKAWKK
jgi:hypothetical protein